MKRPAPSARRPSAGAWPGRCVSFFAVGTHRPPLTSLLLLILDSEQFLRLAPEAAEFIIILGVLVHPLDRLFMPFAGFVLGTKMAVRHGQEKEVDGVAAISQFAGFPECVDDTSPIVAAELGYAKRTPEGPLVRRQLDRFLGGFHCSLRITELGLR